MRRLVFALVAPIVAVALALSTAPANAAHHIHLTQARHIMKGASAYNTHTHVLTSVKGTYAFKRQVKSHGHWRTVTLYGARISAQHCYRLGTRHAHCKGRIIGGPLVEQGAPGRAAGGHPRSGGSAQVNYCYSSQVCANPFFWLKGTARGIQDTQKYITNPCESGGASGFGGGLLGNVVAKTLLAMGAISKEAAVAKMANPESIVFLSVFGCVGKVTNLAKDTAKSFYNRLTHPLGRSTR